jgi:hypothetical protein
MKAQRRVGILAVMLILLLAPMLGCDILSFASGSEGGDGALDEIDLSGDLDEIDLSSGCPQEAVGFLLTLDYQLNVEESNGYIRERTDPLTGVMLVIHGSEVRLSYTGADAETIPGTIEGEMGDCKVEGMTELSFEISGKCETGVASLDIEGTYEIYSRTIVCNGQVVEEFTDSLFDGPSINADFNISTSGDIVDWEMDLGAVSTVYRWILMPVGAPSMP